MKKKVGLSAISYILSLCMIISSVSFAIFTVSAEENSEGTKITILHTNDVHGSVQSSYSSSGSLSAVGCDYLKTMKNSLDAILVDSGDFLQGTPFVSLEEGKNAITMMNAAGYDVTTLGNHEFEFGVTKLLEDLKQATFVPVAANVTVKSSGEAFLKGIGTASNNGSNYIIEKSGKKIGFFGIDTTETAVKTSPENIKEVNFGEEIASAKSQVEALKSQNVDLIICLAHLGDDDTAVVKGKDIAEKVDGVDIVLDGHSHNKENEVYKSPSGNDVLVMQESSSAAYVGQINITFDANGKHSIESHNNIKAVDVGTSYKPSADVTKIAEQLNIAIKEWLDKVITGIDGQFFGRSFNDYGDMAKGFETNLGNLVSDIYKNSVINQIQSNPNSYKDYLNTPVVGIENGGGLRSGMGGLITNEDAYTVVPFPNDVTARLMTPKDLYDVLECGLADPKLTTKDGTNYLSSLNGAFPQIAGMAIEWDVTATARTSKTPYSGNRVKSIYLLGDNGDKKQLLDKNDSTTRIILACNSFVGAGGNNYETIPNFKEILCVSNEFDTLQKGLVNLLDEDKGKIVSYPASEKRITVSNADTLFKNYDAVFTASVNEVKLSNQVINVSTDAGESVQYTTDANGTFTVKNLSQGTHEFKVSIQTDEGIKTAQLMSNNYVSEMKTISFDFDEWKYTGSQVTNIINQIPNTVTQANTSWVKFARNAYEILITTEKAKVTNLQKLIDAEKQIGGGTTGWTSDTNGNWKYLVNGTATTGWKGDIPGWEGQWFYFDNSGIMQTSWQGSISGWDGQWFYFDNSGVMQTSWQENIPGWEGQWFCFGQDGIMKTGWQSNILGWNSAWFCFASNGVMYSNRVTPDGYTVDSRGVWVA